MGCQNGVDRDLRQQAANPSFRNSPFPETQQGSPPEAGKVRQSVFSFKNPSVLSSGVFFSHIEQLEENGKCLKRAIAVGVSLKRHAGIFPGKVLCKFMLSKVVEYFLKAEYEKKKIAFCFFEIDNTAGCRDHKAKKS